MLFFLILLVLRLFITLFIYKNDLQFFFLSTQPQYYLQKIWIEWFIAMHKLKAHKNRNRMFYVTFFKIYILCYLISVFYRIGKKFISMALCLSCLSSLMLADFTGKQILKNKKNQHAHIRLRDNNWTRL